MKDAGRGASGGEPNIIPAKNSDARSACGKRSFTSDCSGHSVAANFVPSCAAVVCANEDEPIIHGITKRNSMGSIPKRKPIEKSFRFAVHELECPGRPTIGCFVDSRFLS